MRNRLRLTRKTSSLKWIDHKGSPIRTNVSSGPTQGKGNHKGSPLLYHEEVAILNAPELPFANKVFQVQGSRNTRYVGNACTYPLHNTI